MSLLPSRDLTLDDLLGGGFIKGSINLIHGPQKFLSYTLMQIAVNSFLPVIDGGWGSLQQNSKVAYVDGLNYFNPYFISKLCANSQLSSPLILKNIMLSRSFTWKQMVETIEDNILGLNHIKLVLIAGMTSMYEHSSECIDDLKRIITGLNQFTEKCSENNAINPPTIIMTVPPHPQSHHAPLGGNQLKHFSNVIIGIHQQMRFMDYELYQHPYLPPITKRFWLPLQSYIPKRKMGRSTIHNNVNSVKNRTLEDFF